MGKAKIFAASKGTLMDGSGDCNRARGFSKSGREKNKTGEIANISSRVTGTRGRSI